MNLRIRTFSMALIAMSAASQVYALPSDESENKEKKEERNVMLNASDANKPREIQIGLPSEDVTVYENGLPAVYSSSVHKLSAHWRSDASLKGTDLMTPSESAIATGNIAYAVSSFSELGQKEFKGKLNYKANHFGMQNVDLNLSGGIGDNWLYTASMYQNFDPGSFKLRFTDYADRTQLYHFGITRILNDGKGRISLLYKYSNSKNPGNFANAAPFIYSGDGSIKKIDGFDPGMDSYVQRQGSFQYLNTKSGKMETWNMSDGSENHANEIALISQYQFDNGWLWKFNAKYMNAPRANYVDYGGSTISQVSKADGYQLSDGSAYSGYIEGRRTWLHVGKVSNALLTTEISKQLNNHKLMIGLNEWYYHLNYYSSSFQWAGTVEAYPRTLSQKYVNPLDPTQTAHRSETFGYNELSPEYTNKRRETYMHLFMDISAVYIKKLDDYRKLVSRKIKAKQTADLLTAINSYKLAEEEAANFYIRFDKAFIDLYPNFVEEFNQLLLPEKQIVLPAPNSLTKELRIYALMRLGITDGQELATLLFYSTQTIYNYKAAIRKRAKDLTTFDAAINRLCNVIG
jgi:hypothetical protein